MNPEKMNIAKTAESIGCRPRDLADLSEEYVTRRALVSRLFRRIRRPDLLACLMTALTETDSCSGLLVHEDSTVFVFNDFAADATKSNGFALSSPEEDVYFIHEEEILKVEPVSFFAGVMAFRLQLENENAMLYMNTSDIDECEENPPLNTGLNRKFYGINDFDGLRDFMADIALLQQITHRSCAGLCTTDDMIDPDACDTEGLITAIETEEDQITIHAEGGPVIIRRDDFREINDPSIMCHHIYMFDVETSQEPFTLLLDADPACVRDGNEDGKDEQATERRLEACFLHVICGVGLHHYEQIYTAPTLKGAIAALLEDGIAEETLTVSPAEALEKFDDSVLLADEDRGRFVCINRIDSPAVMAAVVARGFDDVSGLMQSQDTEDLLARFNKAGMDMKDFSPEEKDELLELYDEEHTCLVRPKSPTPMQRVISAQYHIVMDEEDSIGKEILQDGCFPVSVTDEMIVFEVSCPGYMLPKLFSCLPALEEELNRVLRAGHGEEPYRRLAFTVKEQRYEA